MNSDRQLVDAAATWASVAVFNKFGALARFFVTHLRMKATPPQKIGPVQALKAPAQFSAMKSATTAQINERTANSNAKMNPARNTKSRGGRLCSEVESDDCGLAHVLHSPFRSIFDIGNEPPQFGQMRVSSTASAVFLDSSISPQNLHLIALALICSPQKGQGFVRSSTAIGGGDGGAATAAGRASGISPRTRLAGSHSAIPCFHTMSLNPICPLTASCLSVCASSGPCCRPFFM